MEQANNFKANIRRGKTKRMQGERQQKQIRKREGGWIFPALSVNVVRFTLATSDMPLR
jgi:hypothetical protein